jgi:hypothetical protein
MAACWKTLIAFDHPTHSFRDAEDLASVTSAEKFSAANTAHAAVSVTPCAARRPRDWPARFASRRCADPTPYEEMRPRAILV